MKYRLKVESKREKERENNVFELLYGCCRKY